MKQINISRKESRTFRHKKILKKLSTSKLTHRLLIIKSNIHIYCQVIDVKTGKTLFGISSLQLKLHNNNKENATKVATFLAEKLLSAGITAIIFDRGGYKYHGKIAVIADVLRNNGIKV